MNPTAEQTVFTPSGPGFISPVEALWKKKFQLQQSKIIDEQKELRVAVNSQKAQNLDESFKNDVLRQLSLLKDEIRVLKGNSEKEAKERVNLESRNSRLESTLTKLSSLIDSIHQQYNAFVSESSKLRDHATALENKVDRLQSQEIQSLREQISNRAPSVSDNRILFDLLQFDDARHRINQNAVVQIEELRNAWRAKALTASSTARFDQSHTLPDLQRISNSNGASVEQIAPQNASGLVQPEAQVSRQLSHYFAHSGSIETIPRGLRQEYDISNNRPGSVNSAGSSNSGTLPSLDPPTQDIERLISSVMSSDVPRLIENAATTSSVADPGRYSERHTISDRSYYPPQATHDRIPQPFSRPHFLTHRQQSSSGPTTTPTATTAPNAPTTGTNLKRVYSTGQTVQQNANQPTLKRPRLEPQNRPISAQTVPGTPRPPARIANRTPLANRPHTVTSSSSLQPTLARPAALANRAALADGSMTMSDLRALEAGKLENNREARVNPASTTAADPPRPPTSRKPRRKVDNKPRPWDPTRPRTREQIKRQISEHPELGNPDFVQLE